LRKQAVRQRVEELFIKLQLIATGWLNTLPRLNADNMSILAGAVLTLIVVSQ
jgi:hypothetical protein